MLDLYITISYETPEAMILDRNVLRARSNLRRDRECYRPLIVFINCDWIFENTAQHRRGASLKLEYELNLLHKTHKR